MRAISNSGSQNKRQKNLSSPHRSPISAVTHKFNHSSKSNSTCVAPAYGKKLHSVPRKLFSRQHLIIIPSFFHYLNNTSFAFYRICRRAVVVVRCRAFVTLQQHMNDISASFPTKSRLYSSEISYLRATMLSACAQLRKRQHNKMKSNFDRRRKERLEKMYNWIIYRAKDRSCGRELKEQILKGGGRSTCWRSSYQYMPDTVCVLTAHTHSTSYTGSQRYCIYSPRIWCVRNVRVQFTLYTVRCGWCAYLALIKIQNEWQAKDAHTHKLTYNKNICVYYSIVRAAFQIKIIKKRQGIRISRLQSPPHHSESTFMWWWTRCVCKPVFIVFYFIFLFSGIQMAFVLVPLFSLAFISSLRVDNALQCVCLLLAK